MVCTVLMGLGFYYPVIIMQVLTWTGSSSSLRTREAGASNAAAGGDFYVLFRCMNSSGKDGGLLTAAGRRGLPCSSAPSVNFLPGFLRK